MPDALVSANQLILGQAAANVLGFSNVQEDPTWLKEFADEFRNEWAGVLATFQTTQWSLEDLTVSFIAGSEIDYSVDVPFTVGPLAGTDPGDPLPTQNAMLISTTYVGSRPNRGRVYFMGLTENEQDNSVWDSAVLNAGQTLVERFRDGLGPGGQQAFLRIMRRPSSVFPSYTSNPVELVLPRSSVATQRRRRLGEN